MTKKTMTRRRVLGTAAAAAATAVATRPFVHGAHAAGKLSVAFWDHWVPGANDVMTKLCKEWAAKEKVELQIDFVTSQGDKLMLTAAAEAQARSGHDMITLPLWYAPAQTANLENSDDVWAELIKRHGETTASMIYVGKQEGHWIAPPAIPNTLTLPCVGRIDIFKEAVGIDLTQMYPAGGIGGNKELTVRPGDRPDRRHRQLGRRSVQRLWRPAGRQGWQHHGQIGRGEAGAGVVQEAGAIPASRCLCVG
jgi:hypothetical protein